MKVGSIAFAGVVLLVGVGYEWVALAMPRGSFAFPGPGLFPIIVGGFLIVTALGCVLQELPRRHAATTHPPAPEAAVAGERDVKKTYQLTALTIAYILLLKPVGYPICMVAFLAVAIRIFGFRRWLPTVAIAATIAAVSYVSFVIWLKVPLPLGVLQELLD
jgi:hypothetical protein